MQRRRSMRLAALLASVALLAVGCGGDDADTDTDTGGDATETEATDDGGDAAGGADVDAIREAGTIRVGIKYDQPLFGVNAP
jgi:glutamate transport system substrate-binding protein